MEGHIQSECAYWRHKFGRYILGVSLRNLASYASKDCVSDVELVKDAWQCVDDGWHEHCHRGMSAERRALTSLHSCVMARRECPGWVKLYRPLGQGLGLAFLRTELNEGEFKTFSHWECYCMMVGRKLGFGWPDSLLHSRCCSQHYFI